MKSKLVSVITVCYNSSTTIKETIESVNGQTYQNIEHIFIDGKSTDGTLDIIRSTSIRNTKITSEKDDGIYDAMNKGIALARGDVIAILNSDDCFASKEILAHVVTAFGQGIDIVYGNISYFKNDQNKLERFWRSSEYKGQLFAEGWHPPHPAFFVSRRAYMKGGDFNTSLKIAADFDLMFRFLEVNQFRYKFLDETLVKMRLGGESNRSIKNVLKGNREVRASLQAHGIKKNFLFTVKRIFLKLKQYILNESHSLQS